MRDEEQLAHQLADRLIELGISAAVEGEGVHWHVAVCSGAERSLKVHCVWYDEWMSGLVLGMNPGNARSNLELTHSPYSGPEFYAIVRESGERVADGRTYSVNAVIQCVSSWISGVTLDELVDSAPFIDCKRRAMMAVAAKLPAELRWEILGDPSYDLWVYGSGRSCRIRDESCAYFVRQAQIAFSPQSQVLPSDVEAWLLDSIPIASLSSRNVQLERHAEILERDPARWHWLHVLDRIANPRDVLFEMAPLIFRLTQSEVASRFYSYSSLNRLCFSASSHYPWVGEYPAVWVSGPNQYVVGSEKLSLDGALQRIESALCETSIEPFFGSESEYELELITNLLVQRRSLLRPEIVQREQWSDVWLNKDLRRCRLSSRYFTFFEGTSRLNGECGDIEHIVALALRFLEESAGFTELATDPSVLNCRFRGPHE